MHRPASVGVVSLIGRIANDFGNSETSLVRSELGSFMADRTIPRRALDLTHQKELERTGGTI